MNIWPKRKRPSTRANFILVKSFRCQAPAFIPHNKISLNIMRTLDNWIEEKQLPYIVLNSDTKIRIENFNRFVYPDALVICEETEYLEQSDRHYFKSKVGI